MADSVCHQSPIETRHVEWCRLHPSDHLCSFLYGQPILGCHLVHVHGKPGLFRAKMASTIWDFTVFFHGFSRSFTNNCRFFTHKSRFFTRAEPHRHHGCCRSSQPASPQLRPNALNVHFSNLSNGSLLWQGKLAARHHLGQGVLKFQPLPEGKNQAIQKTAKRLTLANHLSCNISNPKSKAQKIYMHLRLASQLALRQHSAHACPHRCSSLQALPS